MHFLIPITLIVGLLAIWLLIVKSESYKFRAIGGIVFIGLLGYAFSFYHLTYRNYERDYYDSALNGIRELIEKGRQDEAIEPILKYQESNNEGFSAVADLASTISRLIWAEPDGSGQ
ncbi:hypothetical protein QEH59_18270 [Coraliomargarita sp. SDUM461004]|uniref:Uncharacterized protein n=1 Tax=Thalassobacterium sedimentorum TaxID=3041258 RepID=A0ABU1ANK9_9BACT|nr:hypothetical protein [Coraliomargarita sp. SDUM461004]MDQ8196382.1 hypothetical protein [Coraliomargarita sp. SDUM461004]